MIKLYETVIITVIITLLPLIFLAPMITFEFLERKQQKMFQFLLEFRPKNFVFSESSISDDQFKKEKQLSENVNRSREEIRAILSARNHLSPRELLSLMCTSPTQQSSSCIVRRKGAKMLRRYRRNVITDSTDLHVLSRKYSSSMSSSESTSSTKKSSTTIDEFEKLSVGRDVNSKTAESTKSFSESESKNLLKPKTNDARHDVDDDDDDGNIRDATGSVHDGDDDDAMAHPSRRPTSQTLSPTLPT